MSTDTPVTPVSTDPITPDGDPVSAEGAKPDEPLGAPGLAALQSEREARSVAEKAAKDALARVKEFEDRDKSESQKQQEALEQAQRELAELTVAKTRAEVANTKGVPAEILAGPASNSDEDLTKFADALIAFKGEAQNLRLFIPNEGNSPSRQVSNESEFVKELFSSGG